MAEFKAAKAKNFWIVDDNLTIDVSYAKKRFQALTPLKKRIQVQASTDIIHHPDLIKIMRKAGVVQVILGIDSINQESLKGVHKYHNEVQRYRYLFKLLLKNHIIPHSSLMLGFDHDDRDIFKKTVEFLIKSPANIPAFFIFTPVPGTSQYDQFEREGRIITRDLDYYDGTHAVF